MGGFYGSIQIRTDERESVVRAVEAIAVGSGRRFLCGPLLTNWVGVYPDNAGQSPDDADVIAARVMSDVFYLCVHDDDVFYYRFYQSGRLVDEYVSMPSYFAESRREEEALLVGNPERYAGFLDGRVDATRKLLRRRHEQPRFESERLAAFAKLLGIANAVTSYESLTDGERMGIRGWRQFVHVPALDDEKRAARDRNAALRAAKAKLVKQGVLLADRSRARFDRIRSDRSLDHVFIDVGGRELQAWGPDWKRPPRGYCPSPGDRVFTAMSGDGRYAVTERLGARPAVPQSWLRIADTPELWALPECDRIGDGASGEPIFTPDGSRVLFVPGEDGEIVAHALPGGERVGRWPGPFRGTSRWPLLHPVDDVLIAPEQRAIMVCDLVRGTTKRFAVGAPNASDGESQNPYWLIEAGQRVERLGIAALSSLLQLVPERRRPEAERELRRLWPEAPSPQSGFALARNAIRFSPKTDSIVHVRFSSNGNYVYCGTSNGLRVYPWAELLAAANLASAEPSIYFNTPADALEMHPGHGYIYATIDDPANGRVLFGGMDGRIRAASLDTGDVSVVLEPPERAPIMEMHLVGESELICCVLPGFADPKRRQKLEQKQRIQVWNLRAISPR